MNNFLTCDEIKKMISPYFDKELCEKDSQLVEKHLEQCPVCMQELENIKQLSLFIKISPQVFNKNVLPEKITTCMEIRSKLSAFIDGELEKETVIEILEHIINCDFCKKQYKKIKKTHELLKNHLENSFSDDSYLEKDKISLAVIKNIEKIRWQKNKKKIISSIAASVFIIFLSWFSINLINSSETKELNLDKTRFIRIEKPMYVKSEDYFLRECCSELPEEIISLMYDE